MSRKELLASVRQKTEQLTNQKQAGQRERIALKVQSKLLPVPVEDNRKCEKMMLLELWKKPKGTELSTLVNPPLSMIFELLKVRVDLLQGKPLFLPGA
jgi:hypothetical protein